MTCTFDFLEMISANFISSNVLSIFSPAGYIGHNITKSESTNDEAKAFLTFLFLSTYGAGKQKLTFYFQMQL